MANMILDGRAVSNQIKDEIKALSPKWQNKRKPHLVAVLVGENGANLTYVRAKMKACDYVGFKSTLIRHNEHISQNELQKTIQNLNEDEGVDGFIVQLPLPSHIDEQQIINLINPQKDVDGFHPINVGKMALNQPTFLPATPMGILELLKRYNIETASKHCVVVGRSHIVGVPMSILMGQKRQIGNSTVTLVHSRSESIEEICQSADILIVAIGRSRFITENMVKDGAVVIDVGITRVKDKTTAKGYEIQGDVDFENVSKKAKAITPVPGGVGPMTIASLLLNTLKAYKNQNEL